MPPTKWCAGERLQNQHAFVPQIIPDCLGTRPFGREGESMDRITRRVIAVFTVLLATAAVLHAADALQSTTNRTATAALRSRLLFTSDDGNDQSAPRPNLLIIGASSLNSPVGLTQLVGAMLDSKAMPMNIEG